MTAGEPVVAVNCIHHDRVRRSRLRLPVIE
jgi:hypothetical protein